MDKKYFVGVDHGRPGGSMAITLVVDGHKIGVVSEFRTSDMQIKKLTEPLSKRTLFIKGNSTGSIPIKNIWFDEKAFRELMLDSEFNKAPPRELAPSY